MNIYTTAFSSLHTAKIAGKQAPHKAVLLLSIMDLVESGIITSPRVELSEALEGTFARVWKHYIGSSIIFTPKVATPFWHLQNEPFYRLYMKNGQLIKGGTGRYSIKWLRENTYAMLDEKLFQLMQDENARAELRVTLVSAYLKDLHSGTDSVLSALTLLGLFIYIAA